MQRLKTGPLVELAPAGSDLWLDGGHNPAAGIAIAQASNRAAVRVSFGGMKTSLAWGHGQAKREMDALCLAPDERCQTAAGPGALSSSARTKVSGFTPSQTRTGEEM